MLFIADADIISMDAFVKEPRGVVVGVTFIVKVSLSSQHWEKLYWGKFLFRKILDSKFEYREFGIMFYCKYTCIQVKNKIIVR